MKLDGAVAIVTGGATGIGAASARRLAGRGCRVLVNYAHSAAAAEATAEACRAEGVEALAIRGDVAVDADCRAIAAAALDRWGRIDALVNSAGTTRFVDHADLDGLDAADFERIFAVNLLGPFQMTRAVAPALKRTGDGAVVNISSMSGVVGDGSSIPYAASKGALNTLTKSLARVLAPEARVNAVCPDYVEGRWVRDALGPQRYEAILRAARERARLRRVATPEEIAGTVLWLIEGAVLTTGELLNVDAGTLLG